MEKANQSADEERIPTPLTKTGTWWMLELGWAVTMLAGGVSGLMGWPRKTVAMGTMCWTGSFAILGTGVLVLSISMEIVPGLEIISTVSLVSVTVVTSLGFFLELGWTGGVLLIA